MVYTERTAWTLIIGIVMVSFGYAVHAGAADPLIHWLGTDKLVGEMQTLSYAFGGAAVLVGLWQLFGKPAKGHADYYLSTVAGVAFIMLIAFVVKWGLDPLMHKWGKAGEEAMRAAGYSGAFDFAKVMNLNYVVMGIIAGIVVVNVFKIPSWAENGVRLSRLGLKTGVILLGTLYSLAEIAHLGRLSVVLIGFFVLGSVGLVLWMGARRHIPNSMGGVLSAGLGVCGVSASVASAPVVNAKSTEIAYTIGTILLWGVMCMFLFPIIGKAFGMGPVQFGAWAGTGILNSAQVAGAALAFQPNGIETLKVAEIFNITRVLFLPIIVLWLAVWYVKRESNGERVNVGQVIVGKFPVFVLGFILLFALSSTGIFAPPNHYKGKFFDNGEKSLVKTDKDGAVKSKLLKDDQIALLQAEAAKVQREDQRIALARLIENRKVMSIDDDAVLRGVVNGKILSKDATKVLKDSHTAVWHTAPKIKMFRNLIAWFFTFGLVGLGMQITMASIKQAGGQPLVIGSVVGSVKALGALIIVLLFVHETI